MTKPTSFIHPKTSSTRANFDNVTFSISAGVSGKIFIDCHLENCTFVYEGEFFNLRDMTENCVVQTCIVMKKGEKMQTMVSFGLTETQDTWVTKLPMGLPELLTNSITYPDVPRLPPYDRGMVETLQFPVVQHEQPEFSCGIENMIQRFSPAWCNDRTAEMDEDADGEWVRLSDVKAILENL